MHQITTASINFSQGLTDAWSAVARIVPKIVAFIVIFAIGWFIARLLARVLETVLRKVGFERVAERGGVSRALANSKYDATGLVCKVVYYALLLVTLQLALGVFGTNPVSTMIDGVVAWLPRGIVALVIVIVAAAIARVVRDLVGGALSGLSYGHVLATIASVFVLGLGIIAALGQAGIATAITGPVLIAVLAAIVGVIVVGVGGGMVMPMRERWERMLNSAENDARNAKAVRGAYQQGHTDAMTGQPVARPTMSEPGMQGGGLGRPDPGQPGMGGPGMAPGSPDMPPGV